MFHTLRAALIAVLVAWLARPGAAHATGTLSLPHSLAPIALAATGPRLAVVVVPLDPQARAHAGALEQAAEAAAARSTRFTLVPVLDSLNPAAARARAAALELGRQKLDEGRKYLDELDNVKATEAFTAARDALKAANPASAFKELTDAWMLKAASHATGGENGPAKKELEAVIALNPRVEVSPTHFPPDLIKFAEGQRKLVNTAKGELILRTTPSGARVWVDGTYHGISPVTVAGLSPGKHFVSAIALGSSLAQAELGPGDGELFLAPAELAAQLKKALDLAKADPDGPGRDQASLELARAMGVDQVLVVIAKKSTAGEQLELTAMRLEARDGHNAAFRGTTLSPGKADELEQFFDVIFAKDVAREGKSPVTNFKNAGPTTRTIAAYSLLGAGAAGLITGGVFGFMALDRAQAFRDTRQTEVAKSLLLKSQGQGFAIVADISFLIAIAAAATGSVLLFTHPTAVEDSPDAQKRSDDTALRREAERRDADDRRRADDKHRAEEREREERRRAEEHERRRAEDEQRADDRKKEETKPADPAPQESKAAPVDEKPRKEDEPRKSKKKLAAEKKAEEDARKKAEEDAKQKEEAEARKKAEDERKRLEEDKRKQTEKKKKEDDHEDLKNF